MNDNSTKFSTIIDCVKVPLFILIVFIHNSNTTIDLPCVVFGKNTNVPLFYYCSEYISEVIARIAVPCFFFISGLLFLGNNGFNKYIYIKKIHNRINTLLVPYLIWMTLFAIYYFIIPLVIPQLFAEEGHEITISNIISTFWATRGGHAINQLWYVRDLMCCVVITPLLYYLIKKIPVTIMTILFIICFFDITIPVVGNYGFSNTALFFYGTGILFALKKISIIMHVSSKKLWITSSIFFLLSFLDLLTRESIYNFVVHNSFVIFGLIFLFVLFNYLYDRNLLNWVGWRFLSSASFFVYALHLPWVIIPVRKVLFSLFHFSTDFSLLFSYFCIVIVTIVISLLIYCLLLKTVPTITSVISGGRCYKREKV